MMENFCFLVYFCGKKLKNHLTEELISDFSENSTLDFVLFYQCSRSDNFLNIN